MFQQTSKIHSRLCFSLNPVPLPGVSTVFPAKSFLRMLHGENCHKGSDNTGPYETNSVVNTDFYVSNVLSFTKHTF